MRGELHATADLTPARSFGMDTCCMCVLSNTHTHTHTHTHTYIYIHIHIHIIQPIPVAVQSKGLVCDCLSAGTAGSNPAESMAIRLLYLFCR
jgi:hypothetical protein